MTLSALIRKGGLAKVATATPATLATQETENAGTVAEVATVAVASPSEVQFTHTATYGLTVVAIQETAGPDWPEVEANPVLFETLARAIQTRWMRERGEVPAHYTAKTICKHCGSVPIFEGVPERVEGCPWCFNRRKGMPFRGIHGN